MESSQNDSMKRVYGFVSALETKTEQNLAAMLLDSIKHQYNAEKVIRQNAKRKKKPA